MWPFCAQIISSNQANIQPFVIEWSTYFNNLHLLWNLFNIFVWWRNVSLSVGPESGRQRAERAVPETTNGGPMVSLAMTAFHFNTNLTLINWHDAEMSPFPRDVLLIPPGRPLHPADRDTFKQSRAAPRRLRRHYHRRRRRHQLPRNVGLERTKALRYETNKTSTARSLPMPPFASNIPPTKGHANCHRFRNYRNKRHFWAFNRNGEGRSSD